jgi:hypothetical protein
MVDGGLPVMNGRQLIGSGSGSPTAASRETMIAFLDHDTPLSVERMTATKLPVGGWLILDR